MNNARSSLCQKLCIFSCLECVQECINTCLHWDARMLESTRAESSADVDAADEGEESSFSLISAHESWRARPYKHVPTHTLFEAD